MRALLSKSFIKHYKKLPVPLQSKFKERKDLFLQNPFHPLLNNHALSGEYKDYRSINITGDLRAIYEPIEKNVAVFILIDTHSNLYK